jgi:hypothetical protein
VVGAALLAAGWGEWVAYLLGFLFLLYQTWRGWRMGVVRAFLRLLALVGSGFLGWYGGMLAGAVVATIAPGLQFAVWAVVGLLLALAAYIALSLVSMLLFKKTEDNRSTLVRWGFGLGGAALGFCIGLVFLWAAVSGVRALGGMAAAREDAEQPMPRVASGLAGLRDSLERGRTGEAVRRLDPIPDSLYETIGKFSRVTSDPDAMVRMTEYPDVAELMNHPRFVALVDDPEIQRAAERRQVVQIMFHPRLLELATDPEIIALARQVDLAGALNHALQEPTPPTAPAVVEE